jgi:hypothetical protein
VLRLTWMWQISLCSLAVGAGVGLGHHSLGQAVLDESGEDKTMNGTHAKVGHPVEVVKDLAVKSNGTNQLNFHVNVSLNRCNFLPCSCKLMNKTNTTVQC